MTGTPERISRAGRQWRLKKQWVYRRVGLMVVGVVLPASVLCGQETPAPATPEPAVSVSTNADSAPRQISPATETPAVSASGASAPTAVTSPAPVGAAAPVPAPAWSQATAERWWISEAVRQAAQDQPVFFGVRLANAPRAVLVETPKKSYAVGDTLTMRLWGFNDLSREFKGRARTVVKCGKATLKTWEETVLLAPAGAVRLAKYSFDTAELTAGRYSLETSLSDESGRLIQQQVTPIAVAVSRDMEARRKAQAKQEAELKAEAEKAVGDKYSIEGKGWAQTWTFADIKSDAPREADFSADGRARVEGRLKFPNRDYSAFVGADLREERWDVGEEGQFSIKLWETLVEMRKATYALGLGRRIVTWGKLDEVAILDRISPQDYDWFLLYGKQERKLPAFMLNGGYFGSQFQVEGVVLPVAVASELKYFGTDWALFDHLKDVVADGPYPPVAKEIVGAIRVEDAGPPDSPEFALRLRSCKESIDFSVYYMWLHDRLPGLREQTAKGTLTKRFLFMPTEQNLMALAGAGVTPPDLVLDADYAWNQVIGFDFETVFGEYGLRGECAYLSDQPYTAEDFSFLRKDTISTGVGLDHTLPYDIYWNIQWVVDYIPNYEALFITEEFGQTMALIISRDFLDGDMQLALKSLYRVTYDDWMIHPSVSYKFADGFKIELGGFLFEGDPWTLLGRYDTRDLVYAAARFDF